MKYVALNDGEVAVSRRMPQLDVLLVYEDFSAGLRARQALDRILRQLELEADFNVNLWRFDLLREPALLERAANEAAKAWLVFLSAHSQGELPGTVNLWFKQWLERRGGEPCALAVLLDTLAVDPAEASQRLQALRASALAAGVDVFVQAADAFQTERESIARDLHRRGETRTALPEEILHRVEPHPYPDWGINE